MRAMAQDGRLPKQLATCDIPLCPNCIAGKSIWLPWRTKGETTKKAKSVSSPGYLIYVDLLESPTPGFIGHIKSPRLTNHRYRVTTVLVDAFSYLPSFGTRILRILRKLWETNTHLRALQLPTRSPPSINMQKMEDF
jgi:hypothetical protein